MVIPTGLPCIHSQSITHRPRVSCSAIGTRKAVSCAGMSTISSYSPCHAQWARTYLTIDRDRDGDEFYAGLGATTAVCLLHTREEQRHPARQVKFKMASRPNSKNIYTLM